MNHKLAVQAQSGCATHADTGCAWSEAMHVQYMHTVLQIDTLDAAHSKGICGVEIMHPLLIYIQAGSKEISSRLLVKNHQR